MVHIMMVQTGSNRFEPVQGKHKFLEPWTGPSVQFSNFPELWTELCVRFMAVQVRTTVQDRTLTPLSGSRKVGCRDARAKERDIISVVGTTLYDIYRYLRKEIYYLGISNEKKQY